MQDAAWGQANNNTLRAMHGSAEKERGGGVMDAERVEAIKGYMACRREINSKIVDMNTSYNYHDQLLKRLREERTYIDNIVLKLLGMEATNGNVD